MALLLMTVAVAIVAHSSGGHGRKHVYVVRAGDTLWDIAAATTAATRGRRSGRSRTATISKGRCSLRASGSCCRRRVAAPRAREGRKAPKLESPAWISTSSFSAPSGSMPTGRRAPTALLVRRGGERLLFDCAEGTQRQLLRSSVGLVELREVFLTHYHADHYLGLPGMLKTFCAARPGSSRSRSTGRAGSHDLFGSLRRIFGKLHVPVRARRALSRAIASTAATTALETFPLPRRLRGRLRARRARPAGPVRRRGRRRARRPDRPERGALQRGEAVTLADGRVVTPDVVSAAAAGPEGRDRRRHGSRARARGRARRRPARPRGDLLRGRASTGRARPRTRPRPRRPRSRATPPSSCWR